MSWYKSGTVSLTNGSTAVVGTGTSWIAGAAVGEGFIGPDGKTYEIADIASNTALTLGTAYQGSTASGQSYQIIPSQSYIRDLASQAATLISDYGTVLENAGAGKFADGTVSSPGIRFTADENTGIRRPAADTLAIVVNGADKITVTAGGVTGISKTDVGLANVDNTSDATKNAATATLTNKTINLASNTLVATSAQLAAAVTDETGSGSLVFSATAALTGTPTAPTATAGTNTTQLATTAFVGTAVTNERTAAATLTNKTLTSPVITTPTLSTEAIAVTTNNFPTIRPTLNLDFANSQAVDPRITFTRASTATRTNARGVLEVVASGVPRIDYAPVTGVCHGLLIEEARTNLLLRSEEFDNASWTKTSSTVTANASIAPDGAIAMDKFVVDNGVTSTSAWLAQTVTKAATATTYTLSFYAKAAEKGGFRIYVRDSATSANFAIVTFNISTGTIQTAASAGGTFTSASATIVDLGNGLDRCSLTFTTGTETSLSIRPIALNSDGTAFTGNGTDGLFLWGAHLEAGAFPTTYIPTTTAQVTRAADVATMTGTNFSSWYRQDEGAFAFEASTAVPTASAGVVFVASDGTANERVQVAFGSSTVSATVSVGGASQVSGLSEPAATANAIYKAALGYKVNDFAQSVGGSTVDTDTSGSVPSTLTQIQIGHRTTWLNGHIRSIRYYATRLTNAQLQAITAA